MQSLKSYVGRGFLQRLRAGGEEVCLLQWQVDSDPLYHQGSPQATIFEESFLLWTVADGYHDCALSRSSRDSDTHSRGLPEASTLPSGPLCPVLGSRQDPLSFSFQRLRLTAWEVGQGCHQAHVKYLLCFPEGTGCFSQAGEGFCGSALGEVTGLPGRVVRLHGDCGRVSAVFPERGRAGRSRNPRRCRPC